jgi:hypothetical protein
MRRTVLLILALISGCGTSEDRKPTPPSPPAAAASLKTQPPELLQLAGDFLRNELVAAKPGESREERSEKAHYAIGDLFRCGHDVAVVAFKGIDLTEPRYTAMAFYSRGGGRWTLRQLEDNHGLDDAFELKDLSGDGVPEVLWMTNFSAHHEYVSVYRYDREADALNCLARDMGDPEWDGRQVVTTPSSNVGSDYERCGYDWIGDRLALRWRTSQELPGGSYVVGTGDPAVISERVELDVTGKTTREWKIISNAPVLTSRRTALVADVTDIDDKGIERRRVIRAWPDPARPMSGKLAERWAGLVFDAIVERPEKFSAAAIVRTDDGRTLRVSEFAEVEVAGGPPARSIVYECRGVGGREKTSPEAPPQALLIAVAPASSSWIDWEKALTSAAQPGAAPIAPGKEPCLYVRGPAMKCNDAGGALVIESLRSEGRVFFVACRLRPPPESALTSRPLAAISLGRLTPGDYQARVTVNGPGMKESFETSFRVAKAGK